MTRWYAGSVPWTAVTAWAALTSVSMGNYRRQLATPSVGNERVFKVTAVTTGITGASEPSWNLGNNATTVDAGVTWTQVAGQESENSSANWTAPFARASSFPTLSSGDRGFLSQDSAETQASSLQLSNCSQGGAVICVTDAGTVPPVTADLRTTGTINTTGANSITIQQGYWQGITFNAGSSSNQASLQLGSAGPLSLANCGLVLNNTNSNSNIDLTNNDSGSVLLVNTPITFGNASQGILGGKIDLEWRDTPNGIQGTSPTALIKGNGGTTGDSGTLYIHGVDLSGCTGTLIGSYSWGPRPIIANCTLAVGVALFAITTFAPDDLRPFIVHNCDDTTNQRNYRCGWAFKLSQVETNTVIVRTGGASDGVTNISWRYLTGSSATFVTPATGPLIPIRYNTTGSPVTATVELITLGITTAPTNVQIWLNAETLDSAASPLATLHTTQGAILDAGTTLTASTAAWDGSSGLTARQNTHAYLIGDVFKVASNPGRVFFCTSSGTTAGSEPGGYASAVDGGAITDGSATFRAGWRQKLAVTFTPQMKGSVEAIVQTALNGLNATTNGVLYVDPFLIVA